MSEQLWYQDGLRFQCTACGDCCTGAPGYVWVNQQEIDALAAALDYQDVAEFERLFVRSIGQRRSLRERRNYDCVLLDAQTRKCRAYAVRPRQCRTWPFWDSNVSSPEAWQRACDACPGCGQGTICELVEIEAQRRVIHV
jgi:uncharacterized protein